MARWYIDEGVSRYDIENLYSDQDYTAEELAAYYDVSESTIRRTLKQLRITKEHEYSRDELEQLTRDSLYDTLLEFNEGLVDSLVDKMVPAEDEDGDYTINEYVSPRKGHNLPIEIRYRKVGRRRYEVTKFEIRGNNNAGMKRQFQRKLNL